jgi:hypothetical protein
MSYRGKGDRRFNDYHYSWPTDWWYIDLDGIEVCRRCREPLLFYEVTRDPEKATSILYRLCVRANLPGLLLLVPDGSEPFTDETMVSWRAIGTRPWLDGPLSDLKESVRVLRNDHDQEAHGRGPIP